MGNGHIFCFFLCLYTSTLCCSVGARFSCLCHLKLDSTGLNIGDQIVVSWAIHALYLEMFFYPWKVSGNENHGTGNENNALEMSSDGTCLRSTGRLQQVL